MARREVVWQVLLDGALRMTEPAWTPLCEPCAGPADTARVTDVRTCGGCGLRMRSPAGWRGRFCSERCEQRVRRARRKVLSSRACHVCKERFTGRADARFCSPACRQLAYRLRIS